MHQTYTMITIYNNSEGFDLDIPNNLSNLTKFIYYIEVLERHILLT